MAKKLDDDILTEGAEVTMTVTEIEPAPQKRGRGRPPGAKNKPKPQVRAPEQDSQNSEEDDSPSKPVQRREPSRTREVSPREHRWWWLLRMR